MVKEQLHPCPCCNKDFYPADGQGSKLWHIGEVICFECYDKEKKEIERNNKVAELKSRVVDAQMEMREALIELSNMDEGMSTKAWYDEFVKLLGHNNRSFSEVVETRDALNDWLKENF